MMSAPGQRGCFDLTIRDESLSQHGNPLEQHSHQVPWESFCPALEKVLCRSQAAKWLVATT